MKKMFFSAVALAALFVSCQKEENPEAATATTTMNVDVRVDAATCTRAAQAIEGHDLRYTAELWTTGAGAACTAHKVQNESNFTFENVDRDVVYDLLVWADYTMSGSENADLYYDTSSLKSVTLKTCVANRPAADAFCAARQVTANGEAIAMTLTRPFARLNVTVKDLPVDGSRPVRAEIVCTAPAELNVADGSVSADAASTFAGELLAEATENCNVAFCFVPAARGEQTIIAPVIRLLDASGAELRSNTFTNIPLQVNYRTNLSYNAYSADIDVNVGIDDSYADQKKYAPGDRYDVDGVKGIVYQVDETGRHGKIFSLGQIVAAWSTLEQLESLAETTDGSVNTAVILSKNDDPAYPAFAWVRSLGEGWYLPAIEELFDLRYAITSGEKVADIQAAMTAAGAEAFYTGTDNCYWSSTEEGDGGQWNVRYVRFGVEEGDYVGNKRLEHYVRAVYKF